MASLKALLDKANMKSMKLPEKKDDDKNEHPICVGSDEKYPWGLRIELNKDSLEALGLSVADFEVSKEISITAKCDVTSVRKEERMEHSSESVDMQITELAVVKEGK